jgi:hypothetical protein
MEIHLKMFQWIVAFGAEWRKELPCIFNNKNLNYKHLHAKFLQKDKILIKFCVQMLKKKVKLLNSSVKFHNLHVIFFK